MNLDHCMQLVDATWSGLPDDVQAALTGVDVVVVDSPQDETVREYQFDPAFKGVFRGIPVAIQSQEDLDDGQAPMGLIVLNAGNLHSDKDVHYTLLEEIAHALGISHREMEDLGIRTPPTEAGEGDADDEDPDPYLADEEGVPRNLDGDDT